LSEKIIEVSAAVMIRQGKILLTSRIDRVTGEEFWEFPGGKREPGETFASCLKREMMEELDVRVHVLDRMFQITHAYPDKTVTICFMRCQPVEKEPAFRPLDGQRWKWVAAAALCRERLLPADAPLADFLSIAAYC